MNKYSLYFSLVCCLAALKSTAQSFEQSHLFMPLHLDSNVVTVQTQDYIQKPETVIRVFSNGPYQTMLSADKKTVTITVDKTAAQISPMIFETGTGSYSVMLYKSHRRDYTFSFNPKGKTYTKVEVAGDFNNWKPEKSNLKMVNGVWETSMYIAPGHYAYKILANGKWISDPNSTDSIMRTDRQGYNNILTVKDNSDKHPLVLNTKSFTDTAVVVAVHGDLDQFFAFWNNESANVNHTGGSRDYSIAIPASAAAYPRSYIRVFASNGHLGSNEIVVPLKYGKVVTNANDLGRDDALHLTVYSTPMESAPGKDIKSILQKIQDGYFTNLGINTVAITSINVKPGENPMALTRMEGGLADETVLKQVVTEAHKQGINILLGIVADKFNTASDLYKMHPEFFNADNNPAASKTLNFSKQAVVSAVADSFLLWAKKYGIDGYYQVEASNIPLAFWRVLNYKLKEQVAGPQKRQVYIMGEVSGNKAAAGNYTGNGLFTGVMDLAMANNIEANLMDTAKSMDALSLTAAESFNDFGWHSTMGLVTLTGTKGVLASQLQAIKLAMPEIPVIKMSDIAKQNVKASKDEEAVFDRLKKLAMARKTNMANTYGEAQFSVFEDKVFGVTRTYFSNGSVTLVNKSDKPQSITFNVDNAGDDFKPTTVFGTKPVINVYIEHIQTITIDLPPNGIEVLQY